jgi:hypothetical protein
MTILKVDIINQAYEDLRISGITVEPTPEEHTRALKRLEDMAAEWEAASYRLGYALEDDPDPNTEAGIDRMHMTAFTQALAVRLIPAFNIKVPPELHRQASAAVSRMASTVFTPGRMHWSTRHPIGSGNHWNGARYRRFYPPVCAGPEYPKTTLRHDEQVYGIRWNSVLAGEIITASTWTADSGALTIVDGSVFSDDETQVHVRRDGEAGSEILLTNTVDTATRSGLKSYLLVCLV